MQKEDIIYTERDSIFDLYSMIEKKWQALPEPKKYKPHVDITEIVWKGMPPVRGTVGSRYSENHVKARFLPSVKNPYDPNASSFYNSIINIYGEPSDRQHYMIGFLNYKVQVGDNIVTVVIAFDHIEASRKEWKYNKNL